MNFQEAKLKGKPFYSGHMCRTCEKTERYVTNKKCTNCARKRALKEHEGKYTCELPCKNCGTKKRYVRDNQCVECKTQWKQNNQKSPPKEDWKIKMKGVEYS